MRRQIQLVFCVCVQSKCAKLCSWIGIMFYQSFIVWQILYLTIPHCEEYKDQSIKCQFSWALNIFSIFHRCIYMDLPAAHSLHLLPLHMAHFGSSAFIYVTCWLWRMDFKWAFLWLGSLGTSLEGDNILFHIGDPWQSNGFILVQAFGIPWRVYKWNIQTQQETQQEMMYCVSIQLAYSVAYKETWNLDFTDIRVVQVSD